MIKTCGTSLTPITLTVDEQKSYVGQIIWFNSHLVPFSNIPSSDFQYLHHEREDRTRFANAVCARRDHLLLVFGQLRQDRVQYDVQSLGDDDSALAGRQCGWLLRRRTLRPIPSGFGGASSVTWSADISASVSGLNVTWQTGASNWLLSNKGANFPTLSTSPFVPDYNGMEINPALGINACSFSTSDHTGAPEFSGRSYLLITGGWKGSGNWTGDFSCIPACVQVCKPSGGTSPQCVANPVNNAAKSGHNFAGIGLDGVDFEIQGPITVTGDLAIGASGYFHLSNNAWLNSTRSPIPTAGVHIDGGSGLSGGTVTGSLSGLKAAATSLSSSSAALSPTKTFSSISSSTTVNGNGAQNVISVTSGINLGNGQTLTLSGGSSDTFIVNVAGGMTLADGSNINLSGVPPSQVLFNFTGSSLVQIGNANTSGIFLNVGGEILVQNGKHVSEFISGTKLILDCNYTTVTAPACGTNGTPIVPYMQMRPRLADGVVTDGKQGFASEPWPATAQWWFVELDWTRRVQIHFT